MEINSNVEALRYDYATVKTNTTQSLSAKYEPIQIKTPAPEYSYSQLDNTQEADNSQQTDNTSTQEKVPEKTQLEQNMEQVVKELNQNLSSLNESIRFKYSDDINQLYVGVYDTNTNELIRQIPSEEFIALMSKLREMNGQLLDQTA